MDKDKPKAVPILTGRRDNTGILRARDVRQRLAVRNVDPEVMDILEKLAELNHHNYKSLMELASMFDQMIDSMNGVLQVAENMKNRTDQMARAMEPDEGEGSDGSSSRTTN